MEINQRINQVNMEIKAALEQSGRNKNDSVKLIGVTKKIEPDEINQAIDCGIRIIGESRAQELCKKEKQLIPVQKHFIGPLQTNKVKDIIKLVSLIHSVDRISLIKKISSEVEKNNIKMFSILIQLNIGAEESKSGVEKKDLRYLVEEVLGYENLDLIGLMTIPPIEEEKKRTRFYFEELREIKDRIADEYKKDLPRMKELSMGMSGDFKEAILEGATMVRIGSKIFSKRD